MQSTSITKITTGTLAVLLADAASEVAAWRADHPLKAAQLRIKLEHRNALVPLAGMLLVQRHRCLPPCGLIGYRSR